MTDEADRVAAFINREIDGDISSSAAGSKKRGGKENWLAARRSVSMTSNMLIQPLHSYMAHTVMKHYNRETEGERGRGSSRIEQSSESFNIKRILIKDHLWASMRCLTMMCAHRSWSHLTPDSSTGTAWGRLVTSTTRSFPFPH